MAKYSVEQSELLLDSPIIAVRRDMINTATGKARREILEHFSSVAIAAVRDGQLLMVRQYRHGVGRYLWEIPAGLLDMAGELPLDAARRELAEEGGLTAQTWHLLGDIVTSPGFAEEMCRIYLAEDVSENIEGIEVAPAQDEEADMESRWVDLDEALRWVQTGVVENAVAVTAILLLAAGTRRSVEEPYNYRSALAERRKPKAQPGEDMKFIDMPGTHP